MTTLSLRIVYECVHAGVAGRFLQVFQLSLLLVELMLELPEPLHLPRLVAVIGHVVVGAHVREMDRGSELFRLPAQPCYRIFLLENSSLPLRGRAPLVCSL